MEEIKVSVMLHEAQIGSPGGIIIYFFLHCHLSLIGILYSIVPYFQPRNLFIYKRLYKVLAYYFCIL